jgi:hypothetical protein
MTGSMEGKRWESQGGVDSEYRDGVGISWYQNMIPRLHNLSLTANEKGCSLVRAVLPSSEMTGCTGYQRSQTHQCGQMHRLGAHRQSKCKF